ncbi:MAG: segregation/condensation protein A [Candidatus Paceibacterota bacterium]
MKTDFVVQTEGFQGPLSTLLSMIEKRKLYINNISLAKVTNDYVRFVADNQETVENKIEFVRIASTLVLAKSKSLLPDIVTSEDQEEIDELEDRLRAYQIIKNQKQVLADLFGSNMLFSVSPPAQETAENIFAPGTTLTVNLLADKARRSITTLPKESLPTAQIERKVSLAEEIDRLRDRCRQTRSISFSAAVRSDDKRDQVVMFVAILELIKAGELAAEQKGIFRDIKIQYQS